MAGRSSSLLLRDARPPLAVGRRRRGARGRRSRRSRSTRCARSCRPSRPASCTCWPCCSSRPGSGSGSGLATAVASALAFNFFHIPPTGASRSPTTENWVALGVFLVAAVRRQHARRAGARARARGRAAPARGRPRRRAGAAAARRRPTSRAALGAGRPSGSPSRSTCPSAAIELAAAAPRRTRGARRAALPLRAGERRSASLRARRATPPRPRSSGCASASLPSLEALLGAALDARRAPARGRRDAGAAAQRRHQDGAAARRLARPALAADGDRRRGRGARLAAACRRTSARSWPPRSSARRRACRASSTSCSTSRACRRARPSRGATGARSRRCSARRSTRRPHAAGLRASRSTPTCR